jgi:hypothetical protein
MAGMQSADSGQLGIPGVTAAVAPASGTLTYSLDDAPGTPSTTLTQTSSGGPVRVFNMSPGDVTVTLHHPTAHCNTASGWAVGNDSFRTRIIAGARTFEIVTCQ